MITQFPCCDFNCHKTWTEAINGLDFEKREVSLRKETQHDPLASRLFLTQTSHHRFSEGLRGRPFLLGGVHSLSLLWPLRGHTSDFARKRGSPSLQWWAWMRYYGIIHARPDGIVINLQKVWWKHRHSEYEVSINFHKVLFLWVQVQIQFMTKTMDILRCLTCGVLRCSWQECRAILAGKYFAGDEMVEAIASLHLGWMFSPKNDDRFKFSSSRAGAEKLPLICRRVGNWRALGRLWRWGLFLWYQTRLGYFRS